METLVEKALRIATAAHKGQTDKSGAPYILHPIAVAERVEGEVRKAAALLHDTVEDTHVTIDLLAGFEFPKEVTDIVFALTRQVKGGQKEKYFDFIRRIKRSGEDAIAVKLADLDHNSSPERIAKLPPEQQDIVKRYEKARKILTGELK